MSVFGMVIIDWLMVLWIQQTNPRVQVFTFVDDWQVLAKDVAELEPSFQGVRTFTQALDLEIEDAKTYAWTAQVTDRKQVRAGPLKVTLHSKVLGVHHNFCRRFGNRTVQQLVGDGLAQGLVWHLGCASW